MPEAVNNVIAWAKSHPVLAGGLVVGAVAVGYLGSRSVKGMSKAASENGGLAGGAGGSDEDFTTPEVFYPGEIIAPPMFDSGVVSEPTSVPSSGISTRSGSGISAFPSVYDPLTPGYVAQYPRGEQAHRTPIGAAVRRSLSSNGGETSIYPRGEPTRRAVGPVHPWVSIYTPPTRAVGAVRAATVPVHPWVSIYTPPTPTQPSTGSTYPRSEPTRRAIPRSGLTPAVPVKLPAVRAI